MSLFEIGMVIGMVYVAMFVTYMLVRKIVRYVSTHQIIERKQK